MTRPEICVGTVCADESQLFSCKIAFMRTHAHKHEQVLDLDDCSLLSPPHQLRKMKNLTSLHLRFKNIRRVA